MVFNKEVDPTKVLTSNFTLLDKNYSSSVSVTKAVISSDKKKVTLTLSTPGLTAEKHPYTLFINKNDLPVEQNQIAVELSTSAPVVKEVKVDNSKQITIDFDKDVYDATTSGLDDSHVNISDLTDTTIDYTIDTITVNRDLVIELVEDLIPGHNYKVTIVKDVLKDDFGTKNEAIEKTFFVAVNETAPAITSVEYVKSKAAGEIDAIVTFNMPVFKTARLLTLPRSIIFMPLTLQRPNRIKTPVLRA